VSEAGTTYFGAKVTLQLSHSARPLQQIIAKAPATEEQASSASRIWISVVGGTPHRAQRALAYRHHGVAGPIVDLHCLRGCGGRWIAYGARRERRL